MHVPSILKLIFILFENGSPPINSRFPTSPLKIKSLTSSQNRSPDNGSNYCVPILALSHLRQDCGIIKELRKCRISVLSPAYNTPNMFPFKNHHF
ncbi:hypothetical protein AXF42_Ash009790 [Apostasia shenzhenica]|uniref:Uncharacterized protein n=1 Tax=Apostasia shenzhenica TaxID=1088818 RepID=A0A2I0AX58_9ASPA|nr:hypothetical protein AXF42_Ash009790 [Apostasia shenzhenica]